MNSDELDTLAHELRTQNNRATTHPLFLVQQQTRVAGMDSGWADQWEWIDDEGDWSGGTFEVRAEIKENHDLDSVCASIDPSNYGYTRVHYLEHWTFVTAHFTETAAQRYINANAHNLRDPRIYAASQYRCHEWIAVVEHLKGQG